MDEGGAQGDGARVADAQVEELGGGEDAVGRGRVGHRVADYFADLDAADLVHEQHLGGCRSGDARCLGGFVGIREGSVNRKIGRCDVTSRTRRKCGTVPD